VVHVTECRAEVRLLGSDFFYQGAEMGPTIATKPRSAPSRILLYSEPKWGKTSFAAYCPNPIFMMTRGEDGLLTLMNYGRVPEVPHFEDEARTLGDARECVSYLTQSQHDRRTLVIDTINGLARLVAEEVCGTNSKFTGDWAEFESFGRGIAVCEAPWLEFLAELEYLRQHRQMSIVLLAHCRVKSIKNPAGADYDKFMPDLPDKLLAHMNRWADAILFGGFDHSEKKQAMGKVKLTGSNRTLITAESPAHVAGNRYGLPKVIRCGNSGEEAWGMFRTELARMRPKPTKAAEKPAEKPAEPAEAPPAAVEPDPDMGECAN
jgi:hypothetical protein